MFAGIGSFRAGVRDFGWRCAGWAEVDKFARTSYNAIFPESNDEWSVKDVTKVSEEAMDGIGSVDVLMGGSPCQSFSLAGSRKGFDDTRGTLFFEFARFAKRLQPSWLIFENVDGLLSHDQGRTFETILHTFNEIGYAVDFHVYNATEFNTPQTRNRVFLVGKRCDVSFEEGRGTAKRSHGEWKIRERLSPSLFEEGVDFFWFPFPAGPGLTRRLSDLLEPEADEKYFLKPETEAKVRLKLRERQARRSGTNESEVDLYTGLQKTHSATMTIRDNETGTLQAARLDKVPMVSVPVVRHDDGETVEYAEREVANAIDANYNKGLDNHGQRTGVAVFQSSYRNGQEEWEGGETDAAPTLRAQWGGQVPISTAESDVIITSDARGTIKESNIASTIRANAKGNNDMVYARPIMAPERTEKQQNGRIAKENGEPMFTLTAQDHHGVEVAVKSGLIQSRGFETREDGVSHCIKGAGGGSSRNLVELEVVVRSARFHGRESGLELEERDDEVAHCLSSASGGASKGFVTLDIARTVRATRGRSYDDKHSQTLIPTETRIRRLTPREVWRLMGREDWEFDRARDAGISDSQLYKQAGNALIPAIITAIARIIDNRNT